MTMFGTTKEKGFALFEDIARRLPTRRFRAVAGWNESDQPSMVNNIQFAPFELDPTNLYGSSSIVLVPSIVPEGFGRVALEAMAAGRAVVVSDKGALPEVVGDVGIVVPSAVDASPSERWIDAIQCLLDASLLHKKGDAGVSRAREMREYSIGQMEQLLGFTSGL
jgi:glycosyltransferase involved in cell wall biosynthesis